MELFLFTALYMLAALNDFTDARMMSTENSVWQDMFWSLLWLPVIVTVYTVVGIRYAIKYVMSKL